MVLGKHVFFCLFFHEGTEHFKVIIHLCMHPSIHPQISLTNQHSFNISVLSWASILPHYKLPCFALHPHTSNSHKNLETDSRLHTDNGKVNW